MGVISRLPQGGGGGGFVFNITTTEASLFGQDVFITGAETKTVRLSAEGKATVKTKKAGTYTFTCGAAVWSDDYQFYGEYTVVLTLYDAIVNVTGLVSLAPEMDANYIVPGGYYKPNSVDGFQVSLYDGATQIDAPKFFSGGVNTVTFTVDTRVHTNVTVKFSDEDGFITPANVPLSLTKGVTSTASGTWSEKYAVLEVEKADAELLPFNVELSWGASADEKITWQTDNVTVKSQFIVKKITEYTATCNGISDSRNVTELSGQTIIPPIELQTTFYIYKDGDEYETITGGWSGWFAAASQPQHHAATSMSTYLDFNSNGYKTPAESVPCYSISTNKTVDLTGYHTLCVDWEYALADTSADCNIGFRPNTISKTQWDDVNYLVKTGGKHAITHYNSTNEFIRVTDRVDLNGCTYLSNGHILIYTLRKSGAKVHRIWLE